MSAGAPVAALPMYDFPDLVPAHDALWRRIARGLAARGIDAPAALTRGRDLPGLWRDPGLIFSQTCGYPYVTALRDDLALIATPDYAFPGCAGADHRSFIVCAASDRRRRLEDFRGAIAAVNALDSNTGMNLFRAAIAPLSGGRPFFSEVRVTGAHAESLAAIADGSAGLAAIDCVTFGLIARHEPGLVSRIAIVAETEATPGLPFVLSAGLPAATLAAARAALFDALADPDIDEARRALGLTGARVLAAADYRRVLDPERAAEAMGYPTLG
ncbi:ABC-type phosphate/phosphonate transport system substrate-binding protein [Roseiarcus fermentans]|uniref:ABC-type phosphate/phosphonate transport system substrate-binding protein n=1 Tax=Roseiarcus fermentans TaxID=1473586 RepID=A0A366F986_9HYPH|nr:PhnD/SsuA/transferrin family substrate-binding protein [Roseiarcus fermentans]RBP10520.1 ABC-type phosphate/phosphonate transport system substrate-binding protein [Roseiarcus fermentans]